MFFIIVWNGEEETDYRTSHARRAYPDKDGNGKRSQKKKKGAFNYGKETLKTLF